MGRFQKIGKILKDIMFLFFLFVIVFVIVFFSWIFFPGSKKQNKSIVWGVNFSQRQAESLGLDWQKVYLALLNDLKFKHLKISVDWDLIEKRKGEYDFNDLDWQVKKAAENKADIILAIGLKTPRWPECHQPVWLKNKKYLDEEGERDLLEYMKKVVERYKDSKAVIGWQVENEPFFHFGKCPKTKKNLLEREVQLVKSLDPEKPIIITDSGEFSFWFRAAAIGDLVGITMYKKIWFKELNSYITYFFPPLFYYKRAFLVKKIFGKKVICTELQAEPWGPRLLSDNLPLSEQEKTMNLSYLERNIDFAKRTGLDTFYFWGSEWWYWLKTKQNKPEIWQKIKETISG